MADNREEFLTELYAGINVILNKDFTQVPFREFKTRMQKVTTESLRQQVLLLRKLIKEK